MRSGKLFSKVLILVIMSMIVSTMSGISFTVSADGTAVNLALHKNVTVSSDSGGVYPGNLAVDGIISKESRWASDYSDPQWIYVDLGSSQEINRVVLNWEAAYGKSYVIQTSDDADQWVDRYSTTTGDGTIDDISFATVTARYVRMYGTVRASRYGYSLFEFEVYGGAVVTPSPSPSPTPTPSPIPSPASSNLALHKTVAVSTYDTSVPGDYSGGLAVDGDMSTRWGSEYFNPQWIYVDLGTRQNINRVILKWEAAYSKGYAIQTSDDLDQWVDRYTTTTGDGATDDISFNTVAARYVRMYSTAKSGAYGISLYEFEIYGDGTTPVDNNITLNFSGTTATALANYDLGSAVMIVASYNSAGNMVNAETFSVNVQKDIPITEDVGAEFLANSANVKVMLWDGLTNIKPLVDVFSK